ncbi:MAG TPA: V4R domain-containing protein [Dissulfurispiraceae bacterium]|nr:V4R domain-containing protein [Dissulfurispiraceae bacterium]
MDKDRKYQFNWSLLGNVSEGRPNLGQMMRVEVYRLMQYCFRDILEDRYGNREADEITYQAGFLAGKHFYDQMIGTIEGIGDLVKKLQAALKDLGIGILRVEEHDEKTGRIVMTVSEDLDCSGLPQLSYEVCTYDEGFIAAILESALSKKFNVKEIDCWCTGDRTCRFQATPADD